MDFAAQIKAHALKASNMLSSIRTEQATKQFLIIPFIQALGYDIFDPTEVVPEFDANVGASKKYKLDYAICKEGKPIILIECKAISEKLDKDSWSQLFHYFVATNARIGILTNGIIYQFYADLDQQNKMDDKPFLEIDLLNLRELLLDELNKITKSSFDIDKMVSAATEMRYVGGIVNTLTEQMASPSEDFTKFFFSQLCQGKVFASTAKGQFAEYTKRAMKQFVKEQLSNMLEGLTDSGNGSTSLPSADHSVVVTPETSENKIVTTEEELQGYYVVKAILCNAANPSRIAQRDTQSYFGILLDDNKLKPICRLYFNSPKNKKIGIFSLSGDDKQEEKFALDRVEDIYKYADKLRAIIQHYENKVAQVA